MHRLVSPFILQRNAAGESTGQFEAASIFVDMSGFSAMTSALMQHGQHGAEVLATVMRAIFDPLVEIAYAHGGFITGFAGDAFTALFTSDDPDAAVGARHSRQTHRGGEADFGPRLPTAANSRGNASPLLRALAAAWTMREQMLAHPSHDTPYGPFTVAARIGLAFGDVEWAIIREQADAGSDTALDSGPSSPLGTGSRHNDSADTRAPDREATGPFDRPAPPRAAYYFRGPAIEHCVHAQQVAARGDLVLHPSARAVLESAVTGDKGAPGAPPLPGGHLRVVDIRAPLPPTQPIALPEVDADALARFFPRQVVEQTLAGEFRQVVSVFIGLPTVRTQPQLTVFMQTVFALQRHYGGLLNRIDFGDKGAHLLLFWGAPVAHEDDVRRALDFVLDLQIQTTIPIDGGIAYREAHAGHIGSSLAEEYTCYGPGVNLAARLMTAAPRGEIWLDHSTQQAAAALFDIEFIAAMPFKGFAEPQKVYRLLERKEDSEFAYEGPLLGRNAELAALADFIRPLFEPGASPSASSSEPKAPAQHPASSSEPKAPAQHPAPSSEPKAPAQHPASRFAGLLVVFGEPGIGKSRLLHDFLTDPAWRIADACQVFVARTDAIQRASLNPFRYWLQRYFGVSDLQVEVRNKRSFNRRLDDLVAATGDAHLADELDRTRSFLGALVGLRWPDSLYEQLDARGRFENTLIGLTTLLQAESLRKPVVLLLEDAHWLDDDSITFLPRLVRALAAEPGSDYPVAILVAARYEGGKACLEKLASRRIDLNQLSRSNLAMLSEAMLGAPAAPSLLDVLEERAEGNPFFAEQILHYLRDERVLMQSDGAWAVDAQDAGRLPATVHAMLVARLDRLTREVRDVVHAAAVLGREFEVQLLAQMLAEDALLLRKVANAEQAAIWAALSELRYIFKHTLLRDAAYNMQVHTRRAELHLTAAQAMEIIFAADLARHYGRIGYHYEAAYLLGAADARDPARSYLQRAGHQARQRWENAAVIDYATRVLALTPAENLAQRFDFLMAREEAYDNRGQRELQAQDVAALEEIAELSDDDRRRATAALRRSHYDQATSEFAAASAAAERAIALAQAAGDRELEAQGQLAWGLALRRRADFMGAKPQFARALELSVQDGLAELEGQLRVELGFVAVRLGAWAEAESQLAQALPILQARGDLAGEMQCLNVLGISHHDQAQHAAALARFEQALALARRAGRRLYEANYLNNIANACRGLGDWARARTTYEQSLRVCQEIGHRDGESYVYTNMAELALMQGDLDRGREMLELALAVLQQVSNLGEESNALVQLGWCRLLCGDHEGARASCLQALQLTAEVRSRAYEAPPLTVLGHVLAALGELDEARERYAEALALRQELGQLDEAMDARAGLARVALARGDLPAALEQVQTIADYVAGKTGAPGPAHRLAGAMAPLWVYLTWHQVWATAGDPRAAGILEQAYAFLQAQAAALADPDGRRMVLENLPFHREIVRAYQGRAVGGGM